MELPPAQNPPVGQPLPPAQPKSNTGKIVVIIVAAVAVLCLISCVVILLVTGKIGSSIAQTVDTSPADVAAAAEKIASIDLPPGFEPTTSMSLLGMTFAMYEAPNKNTALVVFQMPSYMEMNDANIQQMEEQMQQQSDRQLENMRIIKQTDATIRGKPGKIIIQEGSNNGETFRQMLVVFEGKGGLAMIMVFGPKQGWQQAQYDRMVESIK